MSRPATPRVVAVGLGPAGPELRTEAASSALFAGDPVYLRTLLHPGAASLAEELGASSFDALYEGADRFEDVYQRIVEELVGMASQHGQVVYAVPGSPLVAERSIELLRADRRLELAVVPGLSFCDLAWDRLGLDPLASSVRLIDGSRFATEAAGERGPLLVGQCWSRGVLSEIKLAVDWDGPGGLADPVLLHHLGLPDEQVVTVSWAQLDHTLEPDHLTALYLPALEVAVGRELVALDELVRTLRQRCPWDREQTHGSLKRHLLEETYEVLDAIDRLEEVETGSTGSTGSTGTTGTTGRAQTAPGALDEAAAMDQLEEELGDLLFQVYFHARLASESGQFTVADVARGVRTKLVARHPHVFGDVEANTAGAVALNWELQKKEEKGRASVTEGIPSALPALALAAKLQRKAQSVPGAPVLALDHQVAEARQLLGRFEALSGPDSNSVEALLGDLLWVTADIVRQSGFDPEDLLRSADRRFAERLRALEAQKGDQV